MTTIIVIAFMGMGVAFLAFYVIKSIVSPQRVETVQKFINQGKLPAAVKLGKLLIHKNPHDVEAHYFLGKAFIADKQEELAFEEYKFVNAHAIFEQTIILESEFRAEMAKLYQKFRQHEDALKEYLLLIKMKPREDDYYYQAGKLFENRTKIEQAMSFYQQAVSLNPKHSQAHAAIGLVLYRTKQYAEALKEFRTASASKPDDFSLYFFIGKVLRDMKDFPGAIAALEKSVRDSDYKQRAYIELGGCYLDTNRLDNAVEEFGNAVKAGKGERGDTLLSRYCLAECYEKQRKIDLAFAQWTAISQVSVTYKDVAEKLAEYQDVQTNDSMKEYLMSNSAGFAELAKKVVKKTFGIPVRDITQDKSGCKIVACAQDKNSRQDLSVFYFFRDPEPIDEPAVRKFSDEIKEMNAKQGVVLSSSGFTRQAAGFAEGRLIELYDRAKLTQALNKAGV